MSGAIAPFAPPLHATALEHFFSFVATQTPALGCYWWL